MKQLRQYLIETLEQRALLTASPMITEFQTNNFSTVTDGYGFHSSWIEVFNPSEEAIQLEDWHLTDSPEQLERWSFPSIELLPGEFLLVFASNAPAASEAEPTTNFELDNTDSYLALVSPDGVTVEQEFLGFPKQLIDVSYGVADSPLDAPVFYRTPTPGAANGVAAAPSPRVVTKSGVFTDELEVVIESQNAGLQIHYTLDGTQPSVDSERYVQPFTIDESALLQAVAFDNSQNPIFDPSIPTSANFLAVGSELANDTSDLPVVVIDIRAGGETSIADQAGLVQTPSIIGVFELNDQTQRSSPSVSNLQHFGRAGLRDWGGSAAQQSKANIHMQTWEEFGTGRHDATDSQLLNFSADSEFLLYSPYTFDRSLIRHQVMFELSDQLGKWAPQFREVEVYFNRDNGVVTGSDYFGVYVMMEWPKAAPHRIDVTPSNRFAAPEEIGYVFESDMVGGGVPEDDLGNGFLRRWAAPHHPNDPTVDLRHRATLEQQQWANQFLTDFATSLERAPDINDPDGYSRFIDVGSWVDYHLMTVLSKNPEGLYRDLIVSLPAGGKLQFGPLWDLDRIINSPDTRSADPEEWEGSSGRFSYFDGGNWWGDLFDDAGFWQAYVDRWEELRHSVFSDDNLLNVIDEMANRVGESQARNFARWTEVAPRFGGWENEVADMKSWLLRRVAFMDRMFPNSTSVWINDRALPTSAQNVSVPENQPLRVASLTHIDRSLLASDLSAVYHIPNDDSLGDDWTRTDFDASDWTSSQGGLGFASEDSVLAPFIQTRVNPHEVVPRSTTILARYAFDPIDLKENESLVLRLQYNDGFIAYINGHEVARSQIDVAPRWFSRASSRSPADSIKWQEFALPGLQDQLNVGRNVVAIRAVNARDTNSNLLLRPDLVVRRHEIVPLESAKVYYTTDGMDPRAADGTISSSAILATESHLTLEAGATMMARTFDETDRGKEASRVGTPWSGLLRLTARKLGDANHDGRFDSSDLVAVFQTGRYEDTVRGNATFEMGDWNADAAFNSSDLVAAFQAGNYLHEFRPMTVDVVFDRFDSLIAHEDEDRDGHLRGRRARLLLARR